MREIAMFGNVFQSCFHTILMGATLIFGLLFGLTLNGSYAEGGEVAGVTVIPHTVDRSMRYRRPHDPELAARVQIFVNGPAVNAKFENRLPDDLVKEQEWGWHDRQSSVNAPEGALVVWSFNGLSSRWGVGNKFSLQAEGSASSEISIENPKAWVSAVTFLRTNEEERVVFPNQMIIYVENDGAEDLKLNKVRLWLPREGQSYQILWPQQEMPLSITIPAKEKGFVVVDTGDLPLSYTAIEIDTSRDKLWSHVRIKREAFDISGGWVFDSKGLWLEESELGEGGELKRNRFLDLLSSMHINTAHYENAKGYSDSEILMKRNPLKRFAKLWPYEEWNSNEKILEIHAVEFLGEPQYGGGRPVPPQEVFDKLQPYRESRLATTVTHSEERIWRFYAGLSDYPHFDAYRVVAPAADSWRQYDRWKGAKISWGAPLETIGNLCRSQRELNRPMPCAVWSQGPHDGWGGGFSFLNSRKRRAPNPDELRVQALHALASRITSLYWFNLNQPSLAKFPDTWDSIRRIGREIRMLEKFYLRGDAYEFEAIGKPNGEPDWELSSILSPDGLVLFALDTDYSIDSKKQEFVFGEPREVVFSFKLPQAFHGAMFLRAVDADGLHEVSWSIQEDHLKIKDRISRDRIYILVKDEKQLDEIEERRKKAIAVEDKFLEAGLQLAD